MGTTSIVLAMIEDGFLGDLDLTPAAPVAAMHAVSHDVSLRKPIVLASGRTATALDIQRAFCDRAEQYCASQWGSGLDEQTKDVLTRWADMLDRLERDPMECASEVDWVAKLALLEGYRARDGLGWDAPRLQLVDLQYADVRTDRGLAARLEQRGRLARLADDAQIAAAEKSPPEDTRAYFRGECVRRYPESVAAASWDSLVFDIPGAETLLRVPTMEPARGTAAHVRALLDASPTAADLLAALGAGQGG
jgi:proteasome accessory factor A